MSTDKPAREWWKALDGVAAVNLSEPSPGDLERIVRAYAECRKERDRLRAALEEICNDQDMPFAVREFASKKLEGK